MLRRTVRVLLACALIGWSAQAQAPPLPERMGAINDYAAALGRESRRELQAQIETLERRGVSVVVLITLLDPFSDPARLAEAIRQRWELSEKSVLLLFVREGERWAFEARAEPELSSRLTALRLGAPRQAIQALLNERRVAAAALVAVAHLTELFEPPREPSSPETVPPARDWARETARPFWGSALFWVLAAGGGALALVGGLVWFALTWLCPRCAGRLRRRAPRPFEVRGRSPRRGSIYYCRRCGFTRAARRRGERKRAARPRRRRP